MHFSHFTAGQCRRTTRLIHSSILLRHDLHLADKCWLPKGAEREPRTAVTKPEVMLAVHTISAVFSEVLVVLDLSGQNHKYFR